MLKSESSPACLLAYISPSLIFYSYLGNNKQSISLLRPAWCSPACACTGRSICCRFHSRGADPETCRLYSGAEPRPYACPRWGCPCRSLLPQCLVSPCQVASAWPGGWLLVAVGRGSSALQGWAESRNSLCHQLLPRSAAWGLWHCPGSVRLCPGGGELPTAVCSGASASIPL